MNTRRKFLRNTALGTLLLGGTYSFAGVKVVKEDGEAKSAPSKKIKTNKPVVISTWRNIEANKAAWEVLSNKGTSLDAVEAGVRVPEGDPNDRSVGYGGRPDREGKVTLDSCIMDKHSNCGSVAFLEHIKHPVSVARMVMEKTPHVMLAGEGALQFALENGFKKEDLLTEKSKKEWQEWVKKSKYQPIINIENHDTIGMIALDENGDLSGACTTSGLAYKMRGRVGDSPIIGAGLYVDNEIGAATATGMGEAVIKVVGTHLVVELMRQGHSPQKACELAVERVIAKNPNYKDIQVGFIALNKQGEYGGYCIHKGFSYAVSETKEKHVVDSKSAVK